MNFNKQILIDGREVSVEAPVFVIAEAGVNHGGDIELAKKLIDIAADAGADAVKFQAFRTENLIVEGIDKAPYQKMHTDAMETQSEMLKKLELTREYYMVLKDYCEEKGIIFLITPFDEISLEELEEINVHAYKVASTDTTNLPFLKKIAATGKPMILSTGMCYMTEVEAALQCIYPLNKDVILLQCTANYPIEDKEANLNVVTTFIKKFDMLVGYSDHSVGIGASPYAIPLGARVVEKHFTIDKAADGPDHEASLDPEELHAYLKEIRRVESFLGSFEKAPTESENLTRKSLQKCLVAATNIKKGQIIEAHHMVAKRTGGKGESPIRYENYVGKPSDRDYQKNDILFI